MTTAEQTLRKLALKAAGMTGADVAYAVRQARRTARRHNRNVTFDDIQSQLDAGKPPHARQTLLRMAIHEAGHGVAALCVGIETISVITIRGLHGNAYLSWSPGGRGLVTEPELMGSMVILLAGRAAEEVLGDMLTSGSGGDSTSDLAQATRLAFDMETRLGFGVHQPLVYHDTTDLSALLAANKELLERVNARLELGYGVARNAVEKHERAINFLAGMLLEHETLEGEHLADTLETVKYVIKKAEDDMMREIKKHRDKPGWVTKD